MNDQQIRDCYYVMRAMHDGACPACGHTDKPSAFEFEDGLECPECRFRICCDELKGIKKQTVQAVKRRVDSFHECREELAKLGDALE